MEFSRLQLLISLISPAVEGLDLEKISIEANFVPKEVEFFVEEHIQNPLWGNYFIGS